MLKERLKTIAVYTFIGILVLTFSVGMIYIASLETQPSPEQVLAKELGEIVEKYQSINYFLFWDEHFPIEWSADQITTIHQHIEMKRGGEIEQAYGRYYIETNP